MSIFGIAVVGLVKSAKLKIHQKYVCFFSIKFLNNLFLTFFSKHFAFLRLQFFRIAPYGKIIVFINKYANKKKMLLLIQTYLASIKWRTVYKTLISICCQFKIIICHQFNSSLEEFMFLIIISYRVAAVISYILGSFFTQKLKECKLPMINLVMELKSNAYYKQQQKKDISKL